MIDQLHQFPSKAEAMAAFGLTGPDEAGWYADGQSIVPVTLWHPAPMLDVVEDGVLIPGRLAIPGYWLGVANPSGRLPSCVIEMARPDAPTPWRDCVIWSRSPLAEIAPIMAVDPVFAGSGYVFEGDRVSGVTTQDRP